jgi:histidine ammonia-lyase
MMTLPVVSIGHKALTIENVLELAAGRAHAELDPECCSRIAEAATFVAARVSADSQIYGVTTGVGKSVTTRVPPDLAGQLPLNLLRFHGCGTGAPLDSTQAAAVVAVRVASLARGHSGVRPEVVERLCRLLNLRILPRIPSIGSVGASGDLTPLSYLAALLVGEREALVPAADPGLPARVVPASEALRAADLAPLRLLAKESLSLMNGTSVVTGLACIAHGRAQRLARWVAALTAVASDVLGGNPEHFDARLFDLKPHPGQAAVARWIRADIDYDPARRAAPPARLQDRYSIRCAPHIAGVLVDSLIWMRSWIETEINSVNDNPIVDVEGDAILHGGNFYGGHVGFAMDALKTAVASIADLLDRQLTLLCDETTNAGLPVNLVGVRGPEQTVHHGFKAMGITASALAAEACKLTMPASAFSRSTESHNQDKVPMATLAARDCLNVLDWTETSAAIATLAVCQAVDLRDGAGCHSRARALHASVRSVVPMVREDRRMDLDIAAVLDLASRGTLAIGAIDPR